MNRTVVIIVAVATAIGVLVALRRQPESKQVVNPRAWMVAQDYRTAATPAELEAYQNDAKDKLAKLDESAKFLEQVLGMEQKYPNIKDQAGEDAQHFRDVMQTARDFQKQLPGWKVAIRPAAGGDFSDQAAAKMDEAVAAWSVEWKILRQKMIDMPGPKQPGMTMDGYEALKMAMHYVDVNLILGCNGVEQSHTGNLTVYAWQKGSVQIVVMFEGDKLVSKTQVGL